jgi:hypothetical protein
MAHPVPAPAADEYASFYAGYISHVRGSDVIAILEAQPGELRGLIEPLSESDGAARYAEGKWSVKETLGHMADAERVMSYRLLRVARGDTTPLAGFEQDDYVASADSDVRTLESLLQELEAVRRASLALVRSLGSEAWERRGTANNTPVSARALAHIVAGHWAHHAAILRERYGLGGR